ncbi:MAG: hypothetical protein RR332_01405, partial [Clostridiales bacterium]
LESLPQLDIKTAYRKLRQTELSPVLLKQLHFSILKKQIAAKTPYCSCGYMAIRKNDRAFF